MTPAPCAPPVPPIRQQREQRWRDDYPRIVEEITKYFAEKGDVYAH